MCWDLATARGFKEWLLCEQAGLCIIDSVAINTHGSVLQRQIAGFWIFHRVCVCGNSRQPVLSFWQAGSEWRRVELESSGLCEKCRE